MTKRILFNLLALLSCLGFLGIFSLNVCLHWASGQSNSETWFGLLVKWADVLSFYPAIPVFLILAVILNGFDHRPQWLRVSFVGLGILGLFGGLMIKVLGGILLVYALFCWHLFSKVKENAGHSNGDWSWFDWD
ncbi:MAG: hypothetical protein RL095_2916 [Verrucomicrobiota bacterium]|jgi:hypothetical protein